MSSLCTPLLKQKLVNIPNSSLTLIVHIWSVIRSCEFISKIHPESNDFSPSPLQPPSSLSGNYLPRETSFHSSPCPHSSQRELYKICILVTFSGLIPRHLLMTPKSLFNVTCPYLLLAWHLLHPSSHTTILDHSCLMLRVHGNTSIQNILLPDPLMADGCFSSFRFHPTSSEALLTSSSHLVLLLKVHLAHQFDCLLIIYLIPQDDELHESWNLVFLILQGIYRVKNSPQQSLNN